jgi:hypothetical protein
MQSRKESKSNTNWRYYKMSDYEREDMELAEMMGDKFIDETVPLAEMPEKEQVVTEMPKTKKTAEKSVDAQWEPVKKRTFMDDLTDCMKSTLLFGGLNLLIWYWEISGLMDESVALPSMLVCAALAGLGIGKVLGRK